MRGITKIAFSALCFRSGPKLACSQTFNALRSFVLQASTNRRVLLSSTSHNHFGLGVVGPWVKNGNDYCIQIDILGASFLVDLSTEETVIPEVEARLLEMSGPEGWTVLT